MLQISIIIINYNTFQLTCEAIQSVIETTKGVLYEIILVDNDSRECNPEEFQTRFPSIVLIKNKENLGFSKGNNCGIAVAKGEVIVLLNSDAILKNDGISIAYHHLIENSKTGVVTGKLTYPDGRIQHNCQSFPSITKYVVEILRIHKLLGEKNRSSYLSGFYGDYEAIQHPDWVWGTFFVFRKSILSTFTEKKLPDNYFMYVEDMQWCKEIRIRGYEISYLPEIEVTHLLGGSAGNANAMMLQNTLSFIQTYYKWPSSFLLKFLYK